MGTVSKQFRKGQFISAGNRGQGAYGIPGIYGNLGNVESVTLPNLKRRGGFESHLSPPYYLFRSNSLRIRPRGRVQRPPIFATIFT